MTRLPVPAALIALALASPTGPSAAAEPVTVYRCTDARGQLALRDSPCRAGEKQQVRSMLRPTDPPASRRSTPARTARIPAVLPPTRVVYRSAPRPLYECTTPDGANYTSETPEGNPRWVPLWTLGYRGVVGVAPMVESGYGATYEHGTGHSQVRVDAGRRWVGPGYGAPMVAAVPTGTWVRDVCSPLPAAEVCGLLADRRQELDRRWFSALQGDREAISREQRRIDARLDEECR